MPGLFRHPPQPQQLVQKLIVSGAAPPPFDPSAGFPWALPSDDERQSQPVPDDTAQAWAVGPQQVAAVTPQVFNQPQDAALFEQAGDPTQQSYAIQPPVVAAFDPAGGFPWNREDGETYVVPQVFVEPDSAVAFGFTQAQQAPQNADEPVIFPTTVADDTAQSWAVQPPAAPFNPASGFPWAQFAEDERQAQPTADESIQSWAVGPPAPAFNPATGFPWIGDSEVVQQQPVLDETIQAWAVQPVAPAAFDPSTVPWSREDVVIQPVWWTPDDTAQSWAIGPLPVLPGVFNSPQDVAPPAWVIAADSSNPWTATIGAVPIVTGGRGPDSGGASAPGVGGWASAPLPAGGASGAVPGGQASNPIPRNE